MSIMKKPLMFVDVESTLLKGGRAKNSNLESPIIAISLVKENGEIFFEGRLGDAALENKEMDNWIKGNIIPAIQPISNTFETIEELISAALDSQWWKEYDPVAFCGYILEGHLFDFWETLADDRLWSRPMFIHEMASWLSVLGENPTSDSAYMEKYGLEKPVGMLPHHPTYDNLVALNIWKHMEKRLCR